MQDTFDRLYDTLCRALETTASEKLTSASLDNIFKIVGTMYKLEKLGMGGDEEYSLDGGSNRGSYNSYARGRGSNARRDSMGRYSRYGSNDGGSNSYRGYSRGEGKEEVKEHLKEMMQNADDPQMRQMMQQWLGEMDR